MAFCSDRLPTALNLCRRDAAQYFLGCQARTGGSSKCYRKHSLARRNSAGSKLHPFETHVLILVRSGHVEASKGSLGGWLFTLHLEQQRVPALHRTLLGVGYSNRVETLPSPTSARPRPCWWCSKL